MEPVPQTYTGNQEVLSSELNDLCRRAVGSQPADSNNHLANGSTVTPDGSTEVVWIKGIGSTIVAAGDLCAVDASINWRDRIISVEYAELGAGVSPVNTDDYLLDVVTIKRTAYTGLGALGAASAAVVAGVPPVPASGTSWAMQIATDVWVYATPAAGVLSFYNGTASTITVPMLIVRTTAKTGYRP